MGVAAKSSEFTVVVVDDEETRRRTKNAEDIVDQDREERSASALVELLFCRDSDGGNLNESKTVGEG